MDKKTSIIAGISGVLASIAFTTDFMIITMIAWMAMWFIAKIFNRKSIHIEKPSLVNGQAYVALLLFVFMLCSILWTDNINRAERLLELRFVIPIFCLLLLSSSKNDYSISYEWLMLAFVVGTTMKTVYVLYKADEIYSTQSGQYNEDYGHMIYSYVDAYCSVMHHTLLGISQLIAVIFMFHLRVKVTTQQIKWKTFAYYISLVLTTVIVFYAMYKSEARAMMIGLIIIIALGMIQFFIEKKLYLAGLVIVGLTATTGIIMLQKMERMNRVLIQVKEVKESLNINDYNGLIGKKGAVLDSIDMQMKTSDPRYDLLICGIKCVKEQTIKEKIIGYGMGDYSDKFIQRHTSEEFTTRPLYQKEANSSHNQFIEGQLEYGIIGNILVFSLFIFMCLGFKSSNNRWTAIMISFSWFIYFMIEPVFTRAIPINLFAYSLVMLQMTKFSETSPKNGPTTA